MTNEARALAIVAALLSGASGSIGFVGGRMSAPVPPAEVRFVALPAPAQVMTPEDDPAPIEGLPPAESAPVPKPAPAAPVAAQVDAKPSRPKAAESKEKAKPQKARPAAPKKTLPSCAAIKRGYATMSWAQQVAAYRRATAEEIAYGKRCLGM